MSDEKFKALLAELNQASDEQTLMVKSLPAVDPAPAAAPAAVAPAAVVPGNPEDLADGGVLAKALDDAAAALAAAAAPAPGAVEESIAIDGEEIMKSLGGLNTRMSSTEETLTKGLTVALGLIKGQNELIKSLSDRVEVLGGTGAGRKATLQVNERPGPGNELAKSQQAGMTAGEVLAKASTAWEAKKITGQEFTTVDVALRNGQIPSEAILNKILS